MKKFYYWESNGVLEVTKGGFVIEHISSLTIMLRSAYFLYRDKSKMLDVRKDHFEQLSFL